jgi:hypothetical protein
MKYLIPVIIWIGLLILIGFSIDMRWGSPYGVLIPLFLLLCSLREITKLGKDDNKENSAPPTNDYNITQEDIEGDLHEGRD